MQSRTMTSGKLLVSPFRTIQVRLQIQMRDRKKKKNLTTSSFLGIWDKHTGAAISSLTTQQPKASVASAKATAFGSYQGTRFSC